MEKAMEKKIIDQIKHIETFYEKAPPGFIKEEQEKPEDCIPETEQNRAAREFLANAPTKGLWMPLGKEVKVMQCWRCKNYGHRTGDRECPMFISGNAESEKFREVFEDPMYSILNSKKKQEQQNKLKWLQDILDESSTSSSDNGSSSKKKKKSKKKRSKKKEKSKGSSSSEKWVEKKAPKKQKKRKRKKYSSSDNSSSEEDRKRKSRKHLK